MRKLELAFNKYFGVEEMWSKNTTQVCVYFGFVEGGEVRRMF